MMLDKPTCHKQECLQPEFVNEKFTLTYKDYTDRMSKYNI